MHEWGFSKAHCCTCVCETLLKLTDTHSRARLYLSSPMHTHVWRFTNIHWCIHMCEAFLKLTDTQCVKLYWSSLVHTHVRAMFNYVATREEAVGTCFLCGLGEPEIRRSFLNENWKTGSLKENSPFQNGMDPWKKFRVSINVDTRCSSL